jgi:hypothetical protein
MVQTGLSLVITGCCGVSWFVFHKLFNTTVENFNVGVIIYFHLRARCGSICAAEPHPTFIAAITESYCHPPAASLLSHHPRATYRFQSPEARSLSASKSVRSLNFWFWEVWGCEFLPTGVSGPRTGFGCRWWLYFWFGRFGDGSLCRRVPEPRTGFGCRWWLHFWFGEIWR